MIRNRLLLIMLFLVLTSCRDLDRAFRGEPDRQQSVTIETDRQNSCQNLKRPLNPNTQVQPSETDLDRYFRVAFNAETAGNFDAAIQNYQKATELANCECDRQHAVAGKQAAEEAKNLSLKQGAASKPTQYFWGRLQELTQSLSCVQTIQQ